MMATLEIPVVIDGVKTIEELANRVLDEYEYKGRTIREWADLISEIPPRGRLIDADALERMFADIDNAPFSGFDGAESFYSAEDAVQIIRLAPTIIPAEEGKR